MGDGEKTLREIRSQPEVWRATAARVSDARALGGAEDVVLTGCGSSYYVALVAAATLRKIGQVRATAVPASEAILYPDLSLPSKGLLVAISRSGETSEAVAAARLARARGLSTLAVVCDPDSTLAGEHQSLAFPEALEESLVMTRSFTTMLLALQRLAGHAGRDRGYLQQLDALPAAQQNGMEDVDADSLVYLGAGPMFGLAMEGALKVQEMSLTPSVSFHPLEYRHGPIALVTERTAVVLLATDGGREEERKLVPDLEARGARVIVVDHEGIGEYARPALSAVPCQLLGYHRALARGLDPDVPKNLSRYVKLDLEGNRG